ncbi:MAG: GtrA family protein [Clostridia bacterium]|nr:GtrA family protein [Clostridia bacterium]
MKEFLRFLKFLAVSVGAGVIQIGTFALMNELIRWSYWPSYLISLILSVVWNLTVNRKVTFKSDANIPLALLKIFLFYAVFTPVTTIGGNWLVETVGWNEYLVTALNMVLNFITEFLYQRFVIFRTSIDNTKK